MDITVIDLLSIINVDKVLVEIAKNWDADVRGGGGGSVSDFGHPRTRGGSKKGQIFTDVLYGWPLNVVESNKNLQ